MRFHSKSLTLISALTIHSLLLSTSLLLVARQPAQAQVIIRPPVVVATPAKPPFFVRNYGGKCLDFGAPPQVSGGPVFIYGCNRTIAQQVVVQEINDRHEVVLHAGNKVIGAKANFLIERVPLELQDYTGAAGQIFALDGDSIILAADRNLVVEVQNARGANRTPLVLGRRDMADNEFWDFIPVDGSDALPTSGFVRVPNLRDHRATPSAQFVNAVQNAHWGAVIEVDPSVSLDMTAFSNILIPAGVTIRGDRRGTLMGPELFANYTQDATLLEVNGSEVRVTGLRLRGPSRSTDDGPPYTNGIQTHDRFTTIVDHNDISDWTVSAVNVANDDIRDHRDPLSRPQNVRVARNFLHHNQHGGLGYGVVAGHNAFPFIEGNTFLSNRHAIAADGRDYTGYRAWFNLVQFPAPGYGITNHVEQDFDMHGQLDTCGQHCGGIAGEYVEIARNTFLGGNRVNFRLRGTPTYLADFHDNVLVGSRGDAISNSGDPAHLSVTNNQFDAPNPTDRLGVGDFDGDGKDDLFLATGTAWYFAPAGNAEWRYINAQTEKLDSLLFGDFDGDGRADVFTQRGRDWFVSWGGVSQWEKLNTIDRTAPISDFAVGDFDGDRRADIFYANGQQWFISSGGVGPMTAVNASSFRTADVRFGDFNKDGKTDVFSVVSGNWMVSYGATSLWTFLRSRLTDSVANVVVADFDGDGRADVATASLSLSGFVWRLNWKIAYAGTSDWTTTPLPPQQPLAAVGRFGGPAGADVLLWHGNYLDIVAAGTGPAQRQSRQDMR